MHAHDACMHIRPQFLSLTHAHTTRTASCFTACSYMRSMQYQSRKILMGFFVLFFLSPVRGTNLWQRSGYMVWLRPGSSNICTILISVYFNLLGVRDGWGLPYKAIQCLPESLDNRRKPIKRPFYFSVTSNLPAPVLIVPVL